MQFHTVQSHLKNRYASKVTDNFKNISKTLNIYKYYIKLTYNYQLKSSWKCHVNAISESEKIESLFLKRPTRPKIINDDIKEFKKTKKYSLTVTDAIDWPDSPECIEVLINVDFDELLQESQLILEERGFVPDKAFLYLFKKIENEEQLEKALTLFEKHNIEKNKLIINNIFDPRATKELFTAYFRLGKEKDAFDFAWRSDQFNIKLSVSILIDFIRHFSQTNDIDNIVSAWNLAKKHMKIRNKVIFCIFKSYMDKDRMDLARELRKDLEDIGVNSNESLRNLMNNILDGNLKWKKY